LWRARRIGWMSPAPVNVRRAVRAIARTGVSVLFAFARASDAPLRRLRRWDFGLALDP